jgi:hypothetical protein
MKYLKAIGLVALTALFFSGCETPEDNTISKATSCLDSSDSTNASECSAMVAGDESANAYLIRCSVDFINQGFDATSMANAFSQLSNTSGNTTTAMMSFLVFTTSNTADTNAASTAESDCTKALQPSFALLGAFAQTATLVASLCQSSCTASRTSGFSSAGFATGLTQLYTANDSTNNAIVGTAVLTAYTQECSSSANATSPICEQVVAAIGGSTDPATIGRALITNLYNSQ